MTAADPVLRALAHPVRLRMMSLLWTASMSAAELARELGISHALASQHLRRLDAAGQVELVEVRARRGGRERRYRAVRGTPLSDRVDGTALLAEALAQNLRERAARRAADTPGVTCDAELWVDPQAWERARSRLAEAVAELHDAALPPHAAGSVRVSASVMAFPMTEDTAPDADGTSGAAGTTGVSGAGVSGAGVSGAGVSGAGVSGAGVSGAGADQ